MLMRRTSPSTRIMGGRPADRWRSEALFFTENARSSAISITCSPARQCTCDDLRLVPGTPRRAVWAPPPPGCQPRFPRRTRGCDEVLTHTLDAVVQRLDNAARQSGRPRPRLLAVSKLQPAEAVAALAAAGQRAFGENYVQEAQAKQAALALDPRVAGIEWHLIGHLQSNKAALAASIFDWVQTVDRDKLVPLLAAARTGGPPLNVLVQVNIDDEASKHGCRPDEAARLADAIAAQPRLVLRGLMAIPAPLPDMARRRDAFRRMKTLFDALATRHASMDTLSMGMSEDFELAIAEGATLVRVGTALFGARSKLPK